ncbi:hypothetical protein WN51_07572 [Melipona quadrifasciata]|uniref:Uncharacterized protein n=1 Tax=Melipona quadrifasciata TaxID=166423 RepID=A0A0N0BJ64_9HYME|nr:hypothetical protein WN51_07572 [Melipona quadrifasciata]
MEQNGKIIAIAYVYAFLEKFKDAEYSKVQVVNENLTRCVVCYLAKFPKDLCFDLWKRAAQNTDLDRMPKRDEKEKKKRKEFWLEKNE